MSVLRTLQIVHDHPSWTVGGTELLAAGLAEALRTTSGVTVRLVASALPFQRAPTAGFEPVAEDLAASTGVYDRFMMSRLDGDRWRNDLGALLDAEAPDVIHLHGLDRMGAETLAIIRSLLPAAMIVLTLHDFQIICAHHGLMTTTGAGTLCDAASPDRCHRCFPQFAAERFAMRERFLSALLATVDRFVAPSAFLRDRFVAWGLDASKIHVIRNPALLGIDAVEQPRRSEKVSASVVVSTGAAPAPTSRRRFAYFGRIDRHKGVLVLLEAARRLAVAGEDVSIALHGALQDSDPKFLAAFERALEGAGAVASYRGPYTHSVLPDLMAQTDWVVTPSIWWENSPLTIAEARRFGKPVVCTGVGGMRELVADGVDGLHVRLGDPGDLAATIARAAQDSTIWDRLAAGVRPPPSMDEYLAAHLELYRGSRVRQAA